MRRFVCVVVLVVMAVLVAGCHYIPEPPPADALVRAPDERMLLMVEISWFLPQGYSGAGAAAGVPLLRAGGRIPVEEAYSPRPPFVTIGCGRPRRRGPREALERRDAVSLKPDKPVVRWVGEPRRESVVEGESAPPGTPAPRLVAPGLKDLPRWETLPTK